MAGNTKTKLERRIWRDVHETKAVVGSEVQALLHLDQVEQVRTSLVKIANGCERHATSCASSASDSRSNLLRALDVTELNREKVLTATNLRRSELGLPPLAEIVQTTSLKDGMSTPKTASARIPKVQAAADLTACREALMELSRETSEKTTSSLL
jgi:hypothetical protein